MPRQPHATTIRSYLTDLRPIRSFNSCTVLEIVCSILFDTTKTVCADIEYTIIARFDEITRIFSVLTMKAVILAVLYVLVSCKLLRQPLMNRVVIIDIRKTLG